MTKTISAFWREKGTDQLSSMRLIFVLACVVVLAVWAYTSLASKSVQDIPTGLMAFLGILTAGKTVQRFAERSAGHSAGGKA